MNSKLGILTSMFALIAMCVFTACEDENEDDTQTGVTYDCPNLEADIGDVCMLNPNSQELGIVNDSCACVENDTINSIYDCPDLQANYGDSCFNAAGEPYAAVNQDCVCDTVPMAYDCPDLNANIGDVCTFTQGGATFTGFIDENCNCDVNGGGNFDCPQIQANIGDSCWTAAGNIGVVDANCNCDAGQGGSFDCPDIQANIGDPCDDGNPMTINDVINMNCVCQGQQNTFFDCPGIQANFGDSCWTPAGGAGIVDMNCDCVTGGGSNFDCPDLQGNIGDVCTVFQGGAVYTGFIDQDCNCDIGGAGNYDCPGIQANFGDSCITAFGQLGVVDMNCNCDAGNGGTFDCPDFWGPGSGGANFGDFVEDNTGNGYVNQDCEIDYVYCYMLQQAVGDSCFFGMNQLGTVTSDCDCQ